MLGYLAVEAKPISRSYLAQLFWEDKSEARGRGNLSRVINNLTKLLPGWLLVDYHTVQLNPTFVDQTDISSFKTYLAQGSLGDLVRAVMLYRGDLMADLTLLDCPEFDIWLSGERERWQRQAVQALQQIIDHYLSRSEYDVAISFVERLLDITPWREESHQQMMMILARIGQRSAALTQYEICRRVLTQEFGVEPSAETTELYNRIKAVALKPQHNLPAQPTPFVGRETELGRATHHLSDPDCRLLTLIGPGGIGKTRLALQATQLITQYHYIAFLHGIYFVSLAPVQSVDLLASTIADTIGLSLYGAAKPDRRLLDYLHHKEMLLVLDNFEHLLDGVELIRQILEQAPDVKILVTSRTRLNLRWEWLYEVNGLPFEDTFTHGSSPPRGVSQMLPTQPLSALVLFEHIARRHKSDFSISDQNRTIVTRICQLVDGTPLGVELAASQIQTHSCEEIVQGIEQNLDFLTTSLHDVPSRHQSLRAVFDYSWRFLTEQAQQVFCRLTVLEGGFGLDAAEYVANATGQIIAALVRHSFLQQHRSGRYEIHERLKQYGYEKLKSSQQNYLLAKNKHCTYFADYLKQRELHIGGRQNESLHQINVEIRNIQGAWRWALRQKQTKTVLKLSQGLFEFYDLKGWFKEGKDTFEHALKSFTGNLPLEEYVKISEVSDDESLACDKILYAYSWYSVRLGGLNEGIRVVEQGLAISQKVSTPEGLNNEALLLTLKGIASWQIGDYQAAQESLQLSINLSKKIQNSFTLISSLSHLGITACAIGEITKAYKAHQECFLICKESAELIGLSCGYIYLGQVAYLMKDYEQAVSLLQEGIKLGETIDYLFIVGVGLAYLGYTISMMGKLDQAIHHCQKGLSIFNEFEETYGQTLVLNYLGHIQWTTEAYQDSRKSFRAALNIA
ncbi:MAG TPA: BTAD domain-containing putative transcriptional regulator, partial [Anaerolineae bacterium]|nr:BTAD domain-containing putative transcriptional regulator [Anaerolineae bacterium]